MDDRKIDDIVAMIDQFMSDGGGHMDIRMTEHGETKTVTVTPTLECTPGRDMACGVPTLFEGLDEDDPDA